MEEYVTTGRRKSSIARVYLRRGTGKITINGREPDTFFHRDETRFVYKEPLLATKKESEFDILIKVSGGGETGQAGAIRHGIARALVKHDETLTKLMRAGGFLTRDPRMVERKKYGRRGARKRFQFSKR